jgi:hypothetical protein
LDFVYDLNQNICNGKGQLISKELFWFFQFFQKLNEKFLPQ